MKHFCVYCGKESYNEGITMCCSELHFVEYTNDYVTYCDYQGYDYDSDKAKEHYEASYR